MYEPEMFFEDDEKPAILILQGGVEKNILRHWHSEIELNYTIKGSIDQFFIEGETFKTLPGDILFVNPFEVHGVQNFHEEDFDDGILTVIIPNTFIDKYFPQMKGYHVTKRKINSNLVPDKAVYYKLRKLFEHLAQLAKLESDQLLKVKIVTSILELLLIFAEHFSEKKESQLDINEEKIYEILTYLHENYTERITLAEIAATFYLSESYFARYIKKRIGMSVFNYIEIVRCNHAIEDLRSKKETIEIVAERNGFADTKALNRSLKKIYGHTAKYYKGQDVP